MAKEDVNGKVVEKWTQTLPVPKELTPVAGNIDLDLNRITAYEMADLIQASKSADIRLVSALLTKIVVACPADWGNPAEAETFGQLPYWTHFNKLYPEILAAAQRDSKN